jgi:hypothetical protein
MTKNAHSPSVAGSEPHILHTAAELLALRARIRLEARNCWLDGLGDRPDDPLAEMHWHAGRDMPADTGEIDARIAGAEGPAWRRLIELFQIPAGEADLLSLAIAVAVEPALGPLVAQAQGSPGQYLPTATLAARLFGHRARPLWRSNARAGTWQLVQMHEQPSGQPATFRADAAIVDWLSGHLAFDRNLIFAVQRSAPHDALPEWPVGAFAAKARAILAKGNPLTIIVEGREGSGRTNFAGNICDAIGRDAIIVNAAIISPAKWLDAFLRIQRFALFADAAIIWRGPVEFWPDGIPDAPLQFFIRAPRAPVPLRRECAELRVGLPEPSTETRQRLWNDFAPQAAREAGAIAAIPGISLGDLIEAARAAPASAEDAGAHLRARARSRLSGSGRAVEPVYIWDDLVAPEAVTRGLRAIAFEARHRDQALADPETARMFSGTAALSALFSGPPGVGKSMAAQIVARELCVPLLIIDLAAISSKYVGETAKNLSAAFHEARASGAALLFDEADAFFAKRTDGADASDRYANADTNHLLQLLEEHSGLVFLSTNRRSAIDPAFIRRLRHIVEFPMPGPAERRDLWHKLLLTAGADAAALAPIIEDLSQSYETSPAQIKSAVLTAKYAAVGADRRIGAADLETALAREFAKEGRSVPATPVQKKQPRRTR